MTGPGDDRLDVRLEALRADAELWRGAASDLGERKNHVQGMLIAPAAFSMWAVDAGLDRTYEAVRAQIGRLLDQGGAAFGAIADTLVSAADAYERDDAAGAHRFDTLGG